MNKNPYELLKEEVIHESNRIRRNPKSYIPILEEYIQYFEGNYLTRPDKEEYIETIEGPLAYKEAIEFLKHQKPIPSIEYDEEASKVAEDYLKILTKDDGKTQIEKEEEGNNEERLTKYFDWDYAVSENVDYGGSTGEEVILNLLVDDGVRQRNHRYNLFNTKYGYFGVAVGPHSEYKFCTVIDYFGDIISYKDPAKNKIFQEKKAKNKESTKINKNYFPLTKKGLPLLNNNKMFISKTHQIPFQRGIFDQQQRSPSIKTSDDKSVSEYEEFEEMNSNEKPFANDPDAPEGCIKRKTQYHKKKVPQKTLVTTVKTYLLEDGSEETVTIDEIIYDD